MTTATTCGLTDCQRGVSLPRSQSAMVLNTALRRDPSFTWSVQLAFMREVNKRFNALKRDLLVSIVDNDCFGIQPGVLYAMAAATPRQFAFTRTPDKVNAFMLWLKEQEALGILETSTVSGIMPGLAEPWSNTYIYSAYAKQGVERGQAKLRKAGYSVPNVADQVGGVRAYLSQPFHADRLAMLYTRTFEDLKSVTDVMNASIRRSIADGLTTGLTKGIAEGKNPRVIARELYKDTANHVDKIGKVRARMIARTEVVRAHHLANIAEYRRADAAMSVDVEAEVLTAGVVSIAGYPVCEICIGIQEGGPYTLDEIEGLLPAHPSCRCSTAPVVKEK